jgi:hypothetical protein
MSEWFDNMYFDRQGKPMGLWEWAAIMESGQDRHVADDMVGLVRVSTVWLGLNHNWGEGPPLIFETMVFGGVHDEDQWRYPTEAAALAGHDQVVTMVREAEEQIDKTMTGIKYYLDAQK